MHLRKEARDTHTLTYMYMWASGSMGDRPEALVYFVCFIAIIAYWLLPVIVAVMLDNFSTAAARQEHRHIRRMMVSRDRDGLTESRPLDPLLNVWMSYIFMSYIFIH